MLRQNNEELIFAPIPGQPASHGDRTAWLREVLLAALPLHERDARELVRYVTPHSFRPGLAGDMRRAGMRLDEIAMECRWHGLRNARMYSERAPLTSYRKSAQVRLLRY